MKKVVITGASGFVGRHLTELLKEEKVIVYAVARKPQVSELYVDNTKWIIGDLYSEHEKIADQIMAIGGLNIDCFYHLAWNGVAACDKNNYTEQIKNITIGQNALEVCEKIGCKRFVNLGTVGEYVSLDGLINEKWVPSPADIYGAVKVSVRNLLNVCAAQKGIDMINTILCSTYGEYRCDDNVISYTIKSLLRGGSPAYGSLEQMWDFLYVKDVAYALYLLGDNGGGGKTYSIGSGEYRHLYEYIETIRDIINPELKLDIGKLGNKYEKVLNSCVDTFQLQKDTKFKPRYTFEEGIKRTIAFFEEEIK